MKAIHLVFLLLVVSGCKTVPVAQTQKSDCGCSIREKCACEGKPAAGTCNDCKG